MVALRTHDIMIFGRLNDKLLQKCPEFHTLGGNYNVGITKNSDYFATELWKT